MQVLQKTSRYYGQISRTFETVEVQSTADFSSKHQEESSCLVLLYRHYSTDLQLPDILRHKLFQIKVHFTKIGVFQT